MCRYQGPQVTAYSTMHNQELLAEENMDPCRVLDAIESWPPITMETYCYASELEQTTGQTEWTDGINSR
ncbi:hypothetical protein T265_04659 [Opisthorchis viverrini]|uniref:Uncharacterized protein n=1 Tax=Opisthorchis viverrini TaxID=6198 RepID=A0A074ZMA3_OPIVI|nr:hypothetical protein T265_04659 [Opisthorchis viverrini]KER28523.1 hypothetical protein T265_04659 [Opisthorchis viverrini]